MFVDVIDGCVDGRYMTGGEVAFCDLSSLVNGTEYIWPCVS